MTENIVQVQGVSKIFGGLTAVNKVDLDIPKGEIFSIIGPNGAGKTTLFNCISGFYTPEHGNVLFEGKSLRGKTDVSIPAWEEALIHARIGASPLLEQTTGMEAPTNTR